MDCIRKPALAVFVWFTAAMTVVAGVPRTICLCSTSDGRPRSCCSPFFSQHSGSCCCQGANPSKERGHRCPRCAACKSRTTGSHSEKDTAVGKSGSIHCSGCKRGVSAPQLANHSETKSTANGVSESVNTLPQNLAKVEAFKGFPNVRLAWDVFRVPPRTDLVSAQQRLTI